MSDDSFSNKSNKSSHSHGQDQESKCHCEANLFYNKYKAKIENILAKHLSEREELLADQNKVKEDGTRSIDRRDGRKSSTPSITKRKGKKDRKSDVRSSKETKHPEEDKGHKGDQIQLKKKKDSVKPLKADLDELRATDVRSDDTFQSANLIGPSTSKETQSQHVEFYATALDEKLQQIFGEGGGEDSGGQTERGYYIFDRFVDRSDQSTVDKMSSVPSTSSEGEELYTYHPAKPVEEEWMSDSMKKALEYLKKHKINELFKYLGAHLVAKNPCNPIDFLINLLDNCFNYRLGYCEPPLLYQPKHVESLFHSMDPMGTGLIEMNQYHIGMYTLGIKDYNMFPETIKNNMVQKKTFVHEALNQLRIQLNEMIQNFGTPLTAASPATSIHYFSEHGETELTEM